MCIPFSSDGPRTSTFCPENNADYSLVELFFIDGRECESNVGL